MGKSLKEQQADRLRMLEEIEDGPKPQAQPNAFVAGPKAQAIQDSFKKAMGEDTDEQKKKIPSKFNSILNYIKGK